ncbi:hypothetical protein ACFE04_021362 [Oxalis oulophora]
MCIGADSNEQGSVCAKRGSVSAKLVLSLDSKKCATCCSNTCHCRILSDSARPCSDVTTDRSSGKDHSSSVETSRRDCQAKSTLSSQTSKSDQESDGEQSVNCSSTDPKGMGKRTVSTLINGNNGPSSQLLSSVDSASREGWSAPPIDVEMSPTRALRAAKLKSRFAATILKARHSTLLDNVDITDPVKLQQQKEKLERAQREETARIEAQIRAAEAAMRLKEETELRKQREKEREATRIALQKMEKTVDICENLKIFKELELLSGYDFLLVEDENEDAILNTHEGMELELEEGEEGEIIL